MVGTWCCVETETPVILLCTGPVETLGHLPLCRLDRLTRARHQSIKLLATGKMMILSMYWTCWVFTVFWTSKTENAHFHSLTTELHLEHLKQSSGPSV